MPSQKFKMFAQANFQKKNQNSKFKISLGFTLVELLISVAIMSIIAAIGYVTYGQSQMVARDARRKQDLRAISTALELYRQKNNRYPCIATSPSETWHYSGDSNANWIKDATGSAPCPATTLVPIDTDYINKTPKDPSGTNNILGYSDIDLLADASKRGYAYGYLTTGISGGSCPTVLNGNYYVLVTNLENPNDADSNLNKKYKWCDNTTRISPDTTGNPNLFVISSQ